MSELLPCPFCGDKPRYWFDNVDHIVACINVECPGSPGCVSNDSQEQAAERWNRRTTNNQKAAPHKMNELFNELRESLRWALRRIETSGLGQGEYFAKADAVLAEADAHQSFPDDQRGTCLFGCLNKPDGLCDFSGNTQPCVQSLPAAEDARDGLWKQAVMEISDAGFGPVFKHLIQERVQQLAEMSQDKGEGK